LVIARSQYVTPVLDRQPAEITHQGQVVGRVSAGQQVDGDLPSGRDFTGFQRQFRALHRFRRPQQFVFLIQIHRASRDSARPLLLMIQ
jgi:hypothetical protein